MADDLFAPAHLLDLNTKALKVLVFEGSRWCGGNLFEDETV